VIKLGPAFLAKYTKALKFDFEKSLVLPKILKFVATPLVGSWASFGVKRENVGGV
jgi:hypothetical protein